MAVWIRSLSIVDTIIISPFGHFTSGSGALFWEAAVSLDPAIPLPRMQPVHFNYASKWNAQGTLIEDHPDNQPQVKALGFGTGTYLLGFTPRSGVPDDIKDVFRMKYWRVPYWFLMTPFIAGSAYYLVRSHPNTRRE
jgi:hypothetical protein